MAFRNSLLRSALSLRLCNALPRHLHVGRAYHLLSAPSPNSSHVTQSGDRASYTASSSKDEDTKWIMDMPTRAIAHELLLRERPVLELSKLYTLVNETGLLRSPRHFKHCLRMMRRQGRVQVMNLGPELVGSRNIKYAVCLTKKGSQIFTWYRSVGGYAGGAHWRLAAEEAAAKEAAQQEEQSKGLAEALP